MNAIAAVCKNRGIGKNNDLLFNIPEDKKYFRSMTKGKTIVMGRKTYESLPGGKGLPDRKNIIFSTDPGFAPSDGTVCRSLSELDKIIKNVSGDDIFVIGGAEIYSLLLEKCKKAYITLIEEYPDADRFFPDIENSSDWELTDSSEDKVYEGVHYRFLTFERISTL